MLAGQPEGGVWLSRGNRIVLAGSEVSNGALVRHEILHALLHGGGHPRSEFREACGSLVTCTDVCAAEARRWTLPSQYVRMPPESVAVASAIELMPRESDGQRWISLWISAGNPRNQAVLVAIAARSSMPPTFSYDVQAPHGGFGSNIWAPDSSAFFFAPYETKRWLVEFLVDDSLSLNSWTVTTGLYLIRGGYARQWPVYDTVATSP